MHSGPTPRLYQRRSVSMDTFNAAAFSCWFNSCGCILANLRKYRPDAPVAVTVFKISGICSHFGGERLRFIGNSSQQMSPVNGRYAGCIFRGISSPQTGAKALFYWFLRWFVVRAVGFEPTRAFAQQILSLVCLPFHHARIRRCPAIRSHNS